MRSGIGWGARIAGCAASLALAGSMASCASIGTLSGGILSGEALSGGKAPDSRTTPLTRQNGSLEALEQELSSVKSERVIVPTQLLRALIRNEKLVHRECNAVAGQLEALKNIDLEETGAGK